MKHLLYVVDKHFNILYKFQFAKESFLLEFIEKQNAEENKTNMLVFNFDDDEEIVSLQVYKNGKLFKTTFA